jgi:hypothetical protein
MCSLDFPFAVPADRRETVHPLAGVLKQCPGAVTACFIARRLNAALVSID